MYVLYIHVWEYFVKAGEIAYRKFSIKGATPYKGAPLIDNKPKVLPLRPAPLLGNLQYIETIQIFKLYSF